MGVLTVGGVGPGGGGGGVTPPLSATRTNAVMLARRSMRLSDYPMWPDSSSDKWLLIQNFPSPILSGETEPIPFELMGAEDGRDNKRGAPRERGQRVGSARCRGGAWLVCALVASIALAVSSDFHAPSASASIAKKSLETASAIDAT